MKFDVKLRAGAETTEHKLELRSSATTNACGRVEFCLDDTTTERRSADWVEITPGVYSIILGGRSYEARIATRPGAASHEYSVTVGTREYVIEVQDPRERRHTGIVGAHEGPQEILAPMPGKIVKVLVKENQEVGAGDGLVVIEAMKMQNELRAPRPGRVEKVYVTEGAGVETGFKLLRLV